MNCVQLIGKVDYGVAIDGGWLVVTISNKIRLYADLGLGLSGT